MKNQFLLITIFLLGTTLVTNAQFTISGEFRTRAEINNGLITLPVESSDASFFVSQRTRLNLKYNNDKFTTFLSLQDVRLWGQEDNMTKTGVNFNSGGVDISEAWFDWKFAEGWGLKTGRQIWDYDDGRILSWRNWNQTALSWDAFLLHLDKDDFRFHFGSSINNTSVSFNRIPNNIFDSPFGYRIKYFNFVWLHFQINNSLSLSVNNYLSSYIKEETISTIYSMGTSGLYAEYKSDHLLAKGEVYYQYGRNGFGKEISAYMGSVSGKYNLGKIKIGAGFDYLSGNNSNNTSYNAFDLMYGGRFKFNGWMNYYNLASSTQDNGLVDIYPNISWAIHKKHQIYAVYHFFSLAQDNFVIPDGDGDYSYLNKNIGGELDISYTYKFDKSFSIQAFFGYYFATETTEFIKGVGKGQSTSPYWFSVMLAFKPELFSTK